MQPPGRGGHPPHAATDSVGAPARRASASLSHTRAESVRITITTAIKIAVIAASTRSFQIRRVIVAARAAVVAGERLLGRELRGVGEKADIGHRAENLFDAGRHRDRDQPATAESA